MKTITHKNLKASDTITWMMMILYPAIILGIVFLSVV
jgi:hypothetical protein